MYSEQTWGEAFLCFVFVCVCVIMEANYPGTGLWTAWMDCLHFSGFCQFRHMSWVSLATSSRRSKLIQQGVTSQYRLKRLPGWSVLSLQREFCRDNCLCVCFWLEKTGCAQVSYFSVPCKPRWGSFNKVCWRQNSSGLWSRGTKAGDLGYGSSQSLLALVQSGWKGPCLCSALALRAWWSSYCPCEMGLCCQCDWWDSTAPPLTAHVGLTGLREGALGLDFAVLLSLWPWLDSPLYTLSNFCYW